MVSCPKDPPPYSSLFYFLPVISDGNTQKKIITSFLLGASVSKKEDGMTLRRKILHNILWGLGLVAGVVAMMLGLHYLLS